jgi:hypothetical protein
MHTGRAAAGHPKRNCTPYPSGSTRQVLDRLLRRTRSISRPLLRSRKRSGPALPPYYYTTLLVKKQIITQQKISIYYENVFILIAKN